jgi:2,3-bisphosphoglycerate-independent phosphoglycerate mutase
VPFAIESPLLKPDGVRKFDEFSAKKGAYGIVQNDFLVSLLISSTNPIE